MSEIMLNSSEPEIADIYPLSPMQQGMLFLALNAPGSGMYVEQVTYTLRGELDLTAFERAWQHAAARHAVLRTSLLWEDAGEPLQIVEQEVKVPFAREDWRALSHAEQETRLRAYLEADRRRGFDLAHAPLFRLAIFRVATGAYRVVFTHHHVILDGWSIAVLLDEVIAAYGAYAAGDIPRLPEPRPYRDYIEWIVSQDQDAAEHFWRARLAGFAEPTLINPMPAGKSVEGSKEELRVTLSDELSGRLSELARASQVTLNTIVQGGWGLLLSRYVGRPDVVFGATVSGRPPALAGVEQMIGLFINTLPVRVQVEKDVSVTSWLRQLQREAADAYAYQHARLTDVHAWSEVAAGRALFDTLVVFENYPAGGATGAVSGGEA
ncbi:MAG: hypothetical protein QOG00_1090, partial [Pyrinomonadaceae bacterium]|nr:hypothetical protein [Pyrinomonadaceae bacterium]